MAAPRTEFGFRALLKAVGVVILASLLQLKLGTYFGWAPDFTLVSLFAAAFHFSLPPLALLAAIGFWFLNWRPGGDGILLFYVFLPLAFWGIRPFLPWQAWFGNLIAAAAGITVFYLLSAGYAAVSSYPGIWLKDIFWGSLFGWLAFRICGSRYTNAGV